MLELDKDKGRVVNLRISTPFWLSLRFFFLMLFNISSWFLFFSPYGRSTLV